MQTIVKLLWEDAEVNRCQIIGGMQSNYLSPPVSTPLSEANKILKLG